MNIIKAPVYRYLGMAALVTVAMPALADISYSEAEKLRASGEVLPTQKIVELVKAAKPGEVVELELDRDLGRLVYEVEVRDAQFREWNLELDAKTGDVLGQEEDD